MVTAVVPGKIYTVQASDGSLIQVVFSHKDEAGAFKAALTTEDLLDILVDRYRVFTEGGQKPSPENLIVYAGLLEVRKNVHRRRQVKYKKKHQQKKLAK